MLDNKTASPATPLRGIVKGLLIMAFGLFLGLAVFGFIIGSYHDYVEPSAYAFGWGIFGVINALCLWRGIMALIRCKTRRVSFLTIAVWLILLFAVLALLFSML